MTEQIWETELARGINESQQFSGEPRLTYACPSSIYPWIFSEGMTSLLRGSVTMPDSDTLPCLVWVISGHCGFSLSFKSTEGKEYQGYRCIQWLRNVCHLKAHFTSCLIPQSFLTKLAFAFPSVTMHHKLFCPLFTFKRFEDNNEMLVSIAPEQLYFQGSQLREEKSAGAPREVREEKVSRRMAQWEQRPQAAGPGPPLLRRRRPQSTLPWACRILRQWKDGEQLANPRPRATLAWHWPLLPSPTVDTWLHQLQPRTETPRMALRSLRLIPKAGRTHTFSRSCKPYCCN